MKLDLASLLAAFTGLCLRTRLRLRLPVVRKKQEGQLAIAISAEQFVYAQADHTGRLRRCGNVERGADTPAAFARRIQALGLPSKQVCAVLPLDQAQLLQADAPAVKPEELKAAARWRVKDQVEGRLDDYIIDVMHVGDERPRAQRHIFVAAARNAIIRELSERSLAAGLELAVIDLTETTQRNLQAAVAAQQGLGERATAALVRHGGQCLLTMCAGGELFYARRLDWESMAVPEAQPRPGTLAAAVLAAAAVQPALAVEAMEAMDFIDYGADDPTGPATTHGDDAPRLVIELQRSFDVWERSWPDLPLAALWVQVGEPSARLATLLAKQLGQRVGVLEPEQVFPGLAEAAPEPTLRAALLPLLGALLRVHTKRL